MWRNLFFEQDDPSTRCFISGSNIRDDDGKKPLETVDGSPLEQDLYHFHDFAPVDDKWRRHRCAITIVHFLLLQISHLTSNHAGRLPEIHVIVIRKRDSHLAPCWFRQFFSARRCAILFKYLECESKHCSGSYRPNNRSTTASDAKR